jgi:hypothetical protein
LLEEEIEQQLAPSSFVKVKDVTPVPVHADSQGCACVSR